MAATVLGRLDWNAQRDDEGHREYRIKFLVESAQADGPQIATFAAGLPFVGQPWIYGNDNDFWAYCTPFLDVRPRLTEEPNEHWEIEYKFTTKPLTRCNTTTIENPLAEPDKISGSFAPGERKVFKDKDDNVVKNTAHEPVGVDIDYSWPNVIIEQNRIALGLDTVATQVNTLNNASLWGLASRKIRLSSVSWERKLWGVCTFYYTRRFEFDVNFDGFDRTDVPDRGRKMIAGEWDTSVDPPVYNKETWASAADPTHFIEGTDSRGNLTEHWYAADGTPSATPAFLSSISYYKESNFLTLGIPVTL